MMNKQLLVVMLMLITTFIGFGIIIPVMPELIKAADPGLLERHTGLMLSIYSAVSFLLSPFWGALSDRIGRRPIILTGIVGFAASFILFGIGSDNLTLMYASRVLGGLFSGAVTSVIVLMWRTSHRRRSGQREWDWSVCQSGSALPSGLASADC